MRKRGRWIVVWVALLVLSTGPLSAQERWVYRYSGPGSAWQEWANSVVVGADGNIYAAGLSPGSGTYDDWIAISLTPSGEERWVYRYDGPAGETDRAYSIVWGPDGNLYAAGSAGGIGTHRDFTVISLTPSGAERWAYLYDGPASGWEESANSIAVGTDGDVYAAGWSAGLATAYDFTVVNLDTAGTERWVYSYNGPFDVNDRAYSIVVGPDGNLYAAGYSGGDSIGTGDFAVISLTPSGSERWVYTYDGPGHSSDLAYSILTATDGNVYAAGVSRPDRYWYDITVISLTSSGEERWVYRRPGPYDGVVYQIVMGTDGNLYAAGFTSGSGSRDFAVVSLDTSGAERWLYSYNDPLNRHDQANSIAVGTDGNLYAAGGCSVDTLFDSDFVVVSITPAGDERWFYRYNGPQGDQGDWANSITAGADGTLYAAGASDGGGRYDVVIIGLSPDVAVDEPPEAGAKRQEARSEISASPVPTAGSVEIRYSLSEAVKVTLAIYDVCGELIKKLVNAREEVGSKTVVWDRSDSGGHRAPSGTYFVRLQSADFSATRKLILLQ